MKYLNCNCSVFLRNLLFTDWLRYNRYRKNFPLGKFLFSKIRYLIPAPRIPITTPSIANTVPRTQNLIVTLVSGQPIASK